MVADGNCWRTASVTVSGSRAGERAVLVATQLPSGVNSALASRLSSEKSAYQLPEAILCHVSEVTCAKFCEKACWTASGAFIARSFARLSAWCRVCLFWAETDAVPANASTTHKTLIFVIYPVFVQKAKIKPKNYHLSCRSRKTMTLL